MNRASSVHPVVIARRQMRRRMRAATEPGDEGGFTLIELLITVVVLPIVLGGIAAALLAVFGLQTQTQNRIGNSNDALIGSAHFNKDVQSAEQLTTVSTPACGSAGQTQELGLEWDANSAVTGGYATVVSYVLFQPVGLTTFSLVRQQCSAGATTPTSTLTISRDAGSPTVTITPASVGQTAATGWASAQGVTGITFNISAPGSNYNYMLTGLPGESTSTGAASNVQSNGPPGCSFANPGAGTYSTQLCFADFSSFTNTPSGPCAASGAQTMKLPIANTPDILSFCISASPANSVAPHSIPTYYNPQGDNSEAFLGNNGFYTGIPGNPALYQTRGGVATVTITNIQVQNSVGQAATGWTLVTGDAESTDSGEWMVFQSNLSWSILPNNGSSDLYGNSCYDDKDASNTGLLQWTGGSPVTASGVGDPRQGAPAASAPLTINSTTFATGVSSILCESNQQLNKTGTLMLAAAQGNSKVAQSLTVTMNGAGLEGMFLGVLL